MSSQANQTQIPVIQTQDSELIQVQQNVNKVLRNIYNQLKQIQITTGLTIDIDGVPVGTTDPELNFIQGSGITITGFQSVPLGKIDLTFSSTGGGGTGTVTSVAFSDGSSTPIFSVSGSPITTSGTIIETLISQSANTVFAGPTTGAAAQPTFRALTSADLPFAIGNLTDAGTDGIVITGGTGAVIGSGTSIAQHVADATHNGYLSSTDWSTFNGKQAAGNYITALTGDVTATGPGSVAATLATVNSNVGSFGSSTSIPSFTVNAKGLITAASGNVVIAPAGTLTGTTLASNVVTSSLTSVGTITSGTWNGTTIDVAHGGTSLATLTLNNVILGNGTSAPTFVAPGTSGNVLTSNGTTWTSAAIPTVAPVNATYVTLSTDATLTNERVLTGTANQVIITDNGAGSTVVLSLPQSINTGASPTFTGITLSGLGLGIVHSSSGGVLSSSLIVNADVSATAAIAFSKLASLTSAHILVGNGSNVATDVAVTGDISLTNAGVTAYSGTVPVNKGGTNITGYTTGDLIYASSSTVLSKLAIGSTNQVLVVSGGLPSWQPASTFGVTSITGTANQVIASASTGPVTLSTPQDIATTSTPTFAGIRLNGTGPVSININSVSTNSIEDITSNSFVLQSLLESHTATAATSPQIGFARSRGTQASPTIVAINDAIGFENFYGYTGNSGVGYQPAAQVQYWICADGTTVSTTSMPGRIQFFTTPDLSVTPAERMRINCTGTISLFGPLQMDSNKIIGDTASSGNLTLNSTTNATKGSLIFDDKMSLWPSIPSSIGTATTVAQFNPTFTLTAAITTKFLDISPTITYANGSVAGVFEGISYTPTVTLSDTASFQYYALVHRGTFTSTAAPLFFTFNLFRAGATFTSATNAVPPIPCQSFVSANTIQLTANSATQSTAAIGFNYRETIQDTAASGTFTMSEVDVVSCIPTWKATQAGGALVISLFTGLNFQAPAITATGNITATEIDGVNLSDIASSGNFTLTAYSGIKSAIASGSGKKFLNHSGSADSVHAGNFRIGDTTSPTAPLDVLGKFTVSNGGSITTYNNTALIANGVPSQVAEIAITGRSSAITTATIFTPTATGWFRLSVYEQITTKATTSSILGGAAGTVITYNDGDGNVAQSITMALNSDTGTIVTTSATNTTATNLNGTMVIYARTGVAIQYSIGYTSVGATAMVYSARIRLEAM